MLIFVIYWIDIVIGLSFSAYKQFVIEERAGFNKYTKCRWCKEVMKALSPPFLYQPLLVAVGLFCMFFFKDYFSLFGIGCVTLSGIIAITAMYCCKTTKITSSEELEM